MTRAEPVFTTDPLPDPTGQPLGPAAPGPHPYLVIGLGVWSFALGMAFAVLEDGTARAVAMMLAIWPPLVVLLGPLFIQRVRPHWRRMAAGVALMAVAASVEVVARLSGWTTPQEQSVSDIVFLLAYVLIASGVLKLVSRHGKRQARAGAIDGFVMLLPPLVLLVEYVAYVPQDAESTSSWALRLLVAVYPFLDVVLLAVLVWLVATPTLTRAHLGLMVAGVALLLCVDLFLTMELLSPSSTARAFAEGMYPLTYVVLAAGVSRGALTHLGRPRRQPVVHWGRVGVLAFGAIVGPLSIVAAALPPVPLPIEGLAVATLITSIYIVVRMIELARILGDTTAALARARSELAVQATHDPLTGLLNRSVLDDVLDALRDQQSRPAAVLSIDLDHFKAVNDLNGHAAGDAVLKATAARLRRSLRTDDLVIRMGGDEFLAALPGVRAEEVELLAARLATALEEPVRHDGNVLRVTASVGVAILPSDAQLATLDDVVADADAAMYRAKRAGHGKGRDMQDPGLPDLRRGATVGRHGQPADSDATGRGHPNS